MSNLNISPFPILQTSRLTLRQMQPTDAQQIYDLRQLPEVNKYLSRKEYTNLEEADEFINFINTGIADKKWLYWVLTLTGKDQLIGTVCLWNFSDSGDVADVGYELHPGYQKQGLMQEALGKVLKFSFQELQLKEIQAYTHFQNAASAKLLNKNGFQQTGQKEDEVIFSLKNPTSSTPE